VALGDHLAASYREEAAERIAELEATLLQLDSGCPTRPSRHGGVGRVLPLGRIGEAVLRLCG
jgi:hypothetical protein